jgi:hypothetical protein
VGLFAFNHHNHKEKIMQPTYAQQIAFTGDQEFIEEAKPGFVQTLPVFVNLHNQLAHTSPELLYDSFSDVLTGIFLQKGSYSSQAKHELLSLEHKVIDTAVLALAEAELPQPKFKAVEVYRRFSGTLRHIGLKSRVYGRDAIQVLRDIYLSQTQPDGELNTPFWTDAMTGEIDPEYAITGQDIPEVHVLSPEGGLQGALTEMLATVDTAARSKRPIEISQWQTWCIRRSAELLVDLKWTNEERWAWVEAQGAASGSGEIEDIEEPEDDRGYVPATLTKDLTEEGQDNPLDKSCFFPLSETLRAFNQARKHIFAQMAKENISGQDWKHTFQRRIRTTDEYLQMKAAVQDTANHYGAKEAVAVYLRVAGDYGLLDGEDGSPDDIADIVLDPHKSIASITDFHTFLDEYENDISELMADGSIGVYATEEEVVDGFVKQTKELYSKKYPTHDHNPLNTASWNIAYQNAIASGASFPDAEAKAWSSWRYAMSFFAAKEYDKVMKIERNRTKAMAAFWRFAPPSVPRPQDTIVSVSKSGLNLKKRTVTWNIAKLKLKQDELALNGESALRLHDILSSKGWGNGFDKVLSDKFLVSPIKVIPDGARLNTLA